MSARDWTPADAVHLPYGRVRDEHGREIAGVRLGADVVDLAAFLDGGVLADLFTAGRLEPFFEAGPQIWADVRGALLDAVGSGADERLEQSTPASWWRDRTDAVRGRRLRRLLCLSRSCLEYRSDPAAGRRATECELGAHADRLPRSRWHRRRQRYADHATQRADEERRRIGGLRPVEAAGFRGGGGIRRRRWLVTRYRRDC